MTQPVPNPLDVAEEEEELPPPVLERMISAPFFPELADQDSKNKTPAVWRRGKPHPLTSNTEVRKMILLRGEGVDIYSLETVRGGGVRVVQNFIPMHYVRLVEVLMHPDLADAEIEMSEDRAEALMTECLPDEPDDLNDPEPEPEPASTPTAPPPAPPSNGQVAP